MAHKIGDLVKYGAYGECKIIDRREEHLGGKLREFFVLQQNKSYASTIYVPVEKVDTIREIKRPLTREEISELYKIEGSGVNWDDDDKTRENKYKAAYDRCDVNEIVAILKCILARQAEIKAEKKKLRATELNAIKICQKILYDEISRTMKIEESDVMPLITVGLTDED